MSGVKHLYVFICHQGNLSRLCLVLYVELQDKNMSELALDNAGDQSFTEEDC